MAPGVLWIRMGLPFALNHINLWLIDDELDTAHGRQRGWTVVDCGIASDTTRDAWEVLFASAQELLADVRWCGYWSPIAIRIMSDWRTGCASCGMRRCG
jgi:glyoxylase-like metal-dependent hydrolase (beta-lactamase superfamily II)